MEKRNGFNIGDKVVVTDTIKTDRTGQKGIIIEIDDRSTWHINVKFEESIDMRTSEWFNFKDIAHHKNHIIKEIINDLL